MNLIYLEKFVSSSIILFFVDEVTNGDDNDNYPNIQIQNWLNENGNSYKGNNEDYGFIKYKETVIN